ncbi:LysR substrate-binding domain-containing protein [Xanthobacter sp. V4C-4]|uniref:LysR family transcriptional regulator n=1 Tax=Xanthobacter cornucopiae TaxID=3119924 RepID=UPI00372765DB
MNIRQLQLFVEIARSGSLSGAAAVLGTDQPSLSRQVKQLEEEVGARLFFRTGRGVKLTDVGDDLLGISNRYLNDMSDLRQRIQDERAHPRGRVSLGVVQFLGATFAPDLLMRFREMFPDIAVHITGGNSGVIHEWLLNGRIDVGILYDAGRSHELSGEPILKERTHLFGSRALAEAHGIADADHVPLTALARLPLILTSRHHGLRRAIEHQAARAGTRLSIAYEVDNLATIKALCRAGAGFAPLPCGAHAEDCALEQGFAAPITPDIESVFSMVFARHRPLTPATRELAGLIRTEIRKYALRQGQSAAAC